MTIELKTKQPYKVIIGDSKYFLTPKQPLLKLDNIREGEKIIIRNVYSSNVIINFLLRIIAVIIAYDFLYDAQLDKGKVTAYSNFEFRAIASEHYIIQKYSDIDMLDCEDRASVSTTFSNYEIYSFYVSLTALYIIIFTIFTVMLVKLFSLPLLVLLVTLTVGTFIAYIATFKRGKHTFIKAKAYWQNKLVAFLKHQD